MILSNDSVTKNLIYFIFILRKKKHSSIIEIKSIKYLLFVLKSWIDNLVDNQRIGISLLFERKITLIVLKMDGPNEKRQVFHNIIIIAGKKEEKLC